jgi:23S rRNA pseudouridine2604 synthase
MIEAGRVLINNVEAKLGDQVEDGDEVIFDGKAVTRRPKPVVLAYHKPVGVECTTDRRVEDNILDAVGFKERIFPVGRLDKMSEGLILLTNMGDLVNKILRKERAHEKEYVVVFDQPVTHHALKTMRRGMDIGIARTLPCIVERMGANRVRMVLTEGKNRQIRRMAEELGLKAMRLKRIRVMHVVLGDLKKGKWRLLEGRELEPFLKLVE